MKSGSFFDAKKHRKNTNFNGFSWLDTALTGGQPNYIVFKMPLPTHCVILPRPPASKNKFFEKKYFFFNFINKNSCNKFFFINFYKIFFFLKIKIARWMRKTFICRKKIAPGSVRNGGKTRDFFCSRK